MDQTEAVSGRSQIRHRHRHHQSLLPTTMGSGRPSHWSSRAKPGPLRLSRLGHSVPASRVEALLRTHVFLRIPNPIVRSGIKKVDFSIDEEHFPDIAGRAWPYRRQGGKLRKETHDCEDHFFGVDERPMTWGGRPCGINSHGCQNGSGRWPWLPLAATIDSRQMAEQALVLGEKCSADEGRVLSALGPWGEGPGKARRVLAWRASLGPVSVRLARSPESLQREAPQRPPKRPPQRP